MAHILIVDDDDDFRTTLLATLQSLGHQVEAAASGAEGLRQLREHPPELALIDFRMPDMDGLALMRSASGRLGSTAIVMLTAYASSHNTIEAMKLGAFDHLTKPIGRKDLTDLIERVVQARAGRELAINVPNASDDGDLVGQSDGMRRVHKMIGLAAASTSPVLIHGETGTGKELVAKALAKASDRASAPFVAVNCAAIPAELMESELFGHSKGAFSGAVHDRKGHVREAHRGVLFLDEIGDMPLGMQGKLLRVLQEGEVVPLGSSHPVSVDVRVITASHRNLAAMVESGEFRRDLFYRLNVVRIEVPPLRSRTEDIVWLAQHFLAAGTDHPKHLSSDALERLTSHAWPGNVRELRNVIERCNVLARGALIQANDVDACMDEVVSQAVLEQDWLEGDLPTAVARLEKAMIERALAQAHGNRAEAARQLGIHRPLLYRKLRDYGLD